MNLDYCLSCMSLFPVNPDWRGLTEIWSDILNQVLSDMSLIFPLLIFEVRPSPLILYAHMGLQSTLTKLGLKPGLCSKSVTQYKP
jgi:hypothetical protein